MTNVFVKLAHIIQFTVIMRATFSLQHLESNVKCGAKWNTTIVQNMLSNSDSYTL